MSHTKDELRELQSKSLEEKIQISTARIIEWYETWGGQVYISNSGGVDSTVLSWLVHRIYPDVVDVYCDTGLEYPELREFIMNKPGVVVLKPKMNFIQILSKYGYPIISKEIAIDLDKKYTDHISNAKHLFCISLFDATIIEISPDIKNYNVIALFRNKEDAEFAVSILKNL